MNDAARQQLARHLEGLEAEGVWGLPMAAPAAPPPEETDVLSAQAQAQAQAQAPTSAEPPGASVATASDLVALAVSSEGCELCKLCEQRTNVVFGVGNPDARLMFIGEGPGRDEDLQGEPFVGAAGQLLNKIIAAMGLGREDVYIANTVKCRPPNNRNPQPDELDACRPYLEEQVRLVAPELIVLLGRVAMQAVLDTDAPLGRMRGRFHEWNGIPVTCTYHPAYLLRTPEDKRKTWEDMQAVMERLGLTAP